VTLATVAGRCRLWLPGDPAQFGLFGGQDENT
jgi:hypothetical protein